MRRPERDDQPSVDDRLVKEGSRAEVVRGELFVTPPADEPHGTKHFDLAYLLRAHVAEGYLGAVDMLTRTGHDSDFAPDASIFPAARDARTGGRQLEVMAFEVVSEQWIGVPSEKARELARRGVRRVFCIVLKTGRVLEWSRETDGWRVLAVDAAIEDECLARPLPTRALLDGAEADRAVVEALAARGALRHIEERGRREGEERGRREGEARGRATLLLKLLRARFGEVPAPIALRVEAASIDELDRWGERLLDAASLDGVFTHPRT